METKHTPKPWSCDGGSAISIVADVPGHGPTRIGRAEVVGRRITDEECEANARLFAAAPELLEACKEAKRVYDMMVGMFGDAAFAPLPGQPDAKPGSLAAMLDAAIAKATGE